MSIEVTTLPDGLRIVTDAMPHLETASLGVWIGAGSRHEAEAEQGLSHLLEHMAFKGTRRRTARAINEEIEAVGGDLKRRHRRRADRVLRPRARRRRAAGAGHPRRHPDRLDLRRGRPGA